MNHFLRTKAEQKQNWGIVPNIIKLPNYYYGLFQDMLSFRVVRGLKLVVRCFGVEAEYPACLHAFSCSGFLPKSKNIKVRLIKNSKFLIDNGSLCLFFYRGHNDALLLVLKKKRKA